MFRVKLAIIFLLTNLVSQTIAQQSLEGRFGIGLGYQVGVEFTDFTKINKSFLNQNEQGLTKNLILNGFSSYFYFLILPDTRLTLNILSGKKEIQSSPGRFLSFEKSLWGIGLEYTFSIWHFNLSPGFSIGKAQDFVEVTSYNGEKNLSNIVQNFNSQNITSSSINFENKYVHISPTLNLEYSLSRFTALRFNYTFNIRLNEDWKFLKRYPISNLPENFVQNNHSLSFGLLIGFMSK